MRFFRTAFLIFIIIATSACAKPKTMERHSAGYEGQIIQANNILIIPPAAEINTIGAFGSKERMHDYEYHLEDVIQREIVPAIETKGFKAKALSKQEVIEQNLNNLVMQLRDIYNDETKNLYNPLLWDEEKAFAINQNIGKIAIDLGEKTGTDLILVSSYNGAIKTNSARAAEFALAMFAIHSETSGQNDRAVMTIGIIDAKNGNVLWNNAEFSILGMFSETKNNEDDIKRVNDILAKILAPLQARNMPIKPKEVKK
jgi:hypothetical protein